MLMNLVNKIKNILGIVAREQRAEGKLAKSENW
jgi:hypothetical protein